MAEDLYSGEKSVIPPEPYVADDRSELRWFRSVAALGVVYGTAAGILLPFGMLRFHQGAIPGGFRVNIMDEPLKSSSVQGMWLLTSSLLGAALGITLMVGAIAGVRLKSWALPVLRLWAVASIILGLAGSYLYFQWILPPWREQLAEVRGVVDSLANLGGWIIGSWLAVAMLIVSSLPDVKKAFQRAEKTERRSH